VVCVALSGEGIGASPSMGSHRVIAPAAHFECELLHISRSIEVTEA
jgi:hypothetical protein